MTAVLKSEIIETFEALHAVFASFKVQEIDQVPFEGSWTPGQVGEHILKSISNLPRFFNEKTEATHRPYDEKCTQIREIFLDFNTKMKSPEFIVPLEPTHHQASQLQEFDRIKADMLDAVEHLDLSLTCASFEMPGLGFLTRMEWLTFFMVHTQRHVHQLEKILQVMHQ